MLVVDASFVFRLLTTKGQTNSPAGLRVLGEELVAPELLDIEVISSMRNATFSGELPLDDAGRAVDDLRDLPVLRLSHGGLGARIWSLRDNVTPYDATYVALAEELDAKLLTVDGRLARATGPRCEIELIP